MISLGYEGTTICLNISSEASVHVLPSGGAIPSNVQWIPCSKQLFHINIGRASPSNVQFNVNTECFNALLLVFFEHEQTITLSYVHIRTFMNI